MRVLICLLICALFSCGGSIPDEKRKELRKEMDDSKIVKVTEIEITEAAFVAGRKIARAVDSLRADSSTIRAYAQKKAAEIRFITPDEHTSRLLEQQLVDAYLADSSGVFRDNVQKVRNHAGGFDTLLYTKPVTRKMSDGRDELVGVLNIWLSKKELVKEISRQR